MKKDKKKKTNIPEIRSSPWPQRIAYAALLLLVFSLTYFRISGDDDVFWHLASGRTIIETNTPGGPDAFSWPEPAEQWTTNSWLWDVITFLLWKVTGYSGICIFRTLIILAVFIVWIITFSKLRIPAWLTVVVLAGAAFGMMERFDTRPHIVTFLFFSLLFMALIRFLYQNKRKRKPLFLIPLLFLVWGNFHPSLIIGYLLLLTFMVTVIACYLWPDFFKKSGIERIQKHDVRNLAIITGLALVAGICNPVGPSPYMAIFSGKDNDLLKDIYEWVSPFHAFYSNTLMGTFYKIYLGCSIFIVIYAIVKRDLFALCITILFAIYSTQAVRFAADLFLVVPVLLVLSIHRLLLYKRTIRPLVPALLAGLLCMSTGFYVLSGKIYSRTLIHREPGTGVNTDFYPFQLLDYIRVNDIQNLGKKPFNTYECGGLFVWNFPGKKNFTDSRMANTALLRSYNTIMNKRQGFENEFKRYDFDYAVLFYDGYFFPSSQLILNNMPSNITSYLCEDSAAWKLVYWDDKSFLFLRNEPVFKEINDRDTYQYLTPYNYLYRKQIILDAAEHDPSGFRKELNRKKAEDARGEIAGSMIRNLDALVP